MIFFNEKIKIQIVLDFESQNQFSCFHYWDYLANFWRNNWPSIIDVVERIGLFVFCEKSKPSLALCHYLLKRTKPVGCLVCQSDKSPTHYIFCNFIFRQNYQNTKNRLQDFHFYVFFFCKSPLFGSLVTGLLTVWFLQEIHVTNAEGDRCKHRKNHKRLTLPLAHYYYS